MGCASASIALLWRAGRTREPLASPGGVPGRTLGSASPALPSPGSGSLSCPATCRSLGASPGAADANPLPRTEPGAPGAPPVGGRGGSRPAPPGGRAPATVQTNTRCSAVGRSLSLLLRTAAAPASPGRRLPTSPGDPGKGPAGQGEVSGETGPRVGPRLSQPFADPAARGRELAHSWERRKSLAWRRCVGWKGHPWRKGV